MKYLLIGYGIQGRKRKKILKKNCVGILDPYSRKSDYKALSEINKNIFENAIVSVPYNEQEKIINKLIKMKKNILVDKPLILKNLKSYKEIEQKIKENKIILKTSYNHRYEQSIQLCKKYLKNKKIGKIYYLKIFYGNGTAKNIKSSTWKDSKNGVRTDLISHLIDMTIYLLDCEKFKLTSNNEFCFENNKSDLSRLELNYLGVNIHLEASYLSWKNRFNLEIVGSKGAIQIENLSKWGNVYFKLFERKFPSGRPKEFKKKYLSNDKTFIRDIVEFENMIKKKKIQNLLLDQIIFQLIS